MIVGLGLDAVEIARFETWPTYSPERLEQVFSPQEIIYALSVPLKSPERLAARFAAKEAAYKALSHLMASQVSLITFCKLAQVVNDQNGAPKLQIDLFSLGLPDLRLSVSLTHTSTLAMAVVIAESI